MGVGVSNEGIVREEISFVSTDLWCSPERIFDRLWNAIMQCLWEAHNE
jgi:hypothetical protein